MTGDWARLEALFREALDLQGEARSRFADAAARADPAVGAELRRLLRAHERSAGFLEALDLERAAALLSGEAGEAEAPARDASGPDRVSEAAQAGGSSGEQGGGRFAVPDGESAAVIGRYRVLRRIGSGGMGVVYLAHDPRLERNVALKLLPPRLAADAAAKRRLMEEARAASALDHPHIGTVFEVDETADGRPFIAMAAYDGETLRDRLKRGAVPGSEAFELARQLAAGLAAAHERGIVHRDIKPGNVIITMAGVAKIVDFGVAKVPGSMLTEPGATVGTIAYMSPEQTAGAAIDARTDVWSLGVVMHEMLSGRQPFERDDDRATILAIRHDDAPPIEEPARAAAGALVAVVGRCLEKQPDRRYTDGAALAAALDSAALTAAATGAATRSSVVPSWVRSRARAIVGIAAVAVLGTAGVFGAVTLRGGGAAESGAVADAARPLRIAVLPFDDVERAEEDRYFAEGLTDELTARLSMVGGLRVIGRVSVLEYVGDGGTLREIAGALGVDAVVHGSARRQRDSIRVSVSLVDARTLESRWARVYDASIEDALAVQREVAERVAASLPVELNAAERRRLVDFGTEIDAAHDAYLRGRYHWNRRDVGSLRRALEQFQAALAADPLYAPAYAGLADTYELLGSSDAVAGESAADVAKAAALRALELDPDLAEAHAAVATMLTTYEHDWAGAERHYRRAIESNPNYVIAHQRYSALLSSLGRTEEAMVEAGRALELDPLSSYARAAVGYSLYLARRFDEAIDHLRTAQAMDPAFGLTYVNLGLAYLAAGDVAAAVETLEALDRVWTDSPVAIGLLGHAFARTGDRAAADAQLERLLRLRDRQFVSSFHVAVLRVGLGDVEAAIADFERAVDQREGLVQFLGVDPVFDPLRSHPDYQRLLDRLHL